MRISYKLDDVARIVALDLRNPLSTIVMEADVLSRGEQGPGRSVAESASLIRDAAQRINRPIRDWLDRHSERLSVEEAQHPTLEDVDIRVAPVRTPLGTH